MFREDTGSTKHKRKRTQIKNYFIQWKSLLRNEKAFNRLGKNFQHIEQQKDSSPEYVRNAYKSLTNWNTS